MLQAATDLLYTYDAYYHIDIVHRAAIIFLCLVLLLTSWRVWLMVQLLGDDNSKIL